MNGTASASPTIPRESGSLVRAYTCHATTVAWICVPSVTATRLATYQRKLGLRSDTYGSCCSAIPRGRDSGSRMIRRHDILGNLRVARCARAHSISHPTSETGGNPVAVAATIKPERSEFLPYYGKYIDLVASGDVLTTLSKQMAETLRLLRSLHASVATYRYAPGK